MNPFQIFIAFASVIVVLMVLSCICDGSRKKNQTSEQPNAMPRAATSSVQLAFRDVERGQTAKSRATKDGEMVVYTGAVATAAVVAGASGCGGCGGGGCGGGGGGCAC
ncbi:hypothetical protein FH972_008184 [Carpinus fangiana]|uniref:Uncharacterized protein n=1 Tax=Carpinus fangiana TaxID=176857 RepID=A0A5N6R085_9ROSI|nr:hypothetical protein FH972_008184 [Carpinus fangiana]